MPKNFTLSILLSASAIKKEKSKYRKLWSKYWLLKGKKQTRCYENLMREFALQIIFLILHWCLIKRLARAELNLLEGPRYFVISRYFIINLIK